MLPSLCQVTCLSLGKQLTQSIPPRPQGRACQLVSRLGLTLQQGSHYLSHEDKPLPLATACSSNVFSPGKYGPGSFLKKERTVLVILSGGAPALDAQLLCISSPPYLFAYSLLSLVLGKSRFHSSTITSAVGTLYIH